MDAVSPRRLNYPASLSPVLHDEQGKPCYLGEDLNSLGTFSFEMTPVVRTSRFRGLSLRGNQQSGFRRGRPLEGGIDPLLDPLAVRRMRRESAEEGTTDPRCKRHVPRAALGHAGL